MGSYFSSQKYSPEDQNLGNYLKSSGQELITHTEKIINSKKPLQMNQGHTLIKNSIEKDLKSLHKIIEDGGEIKLGILSRCPQLNSIVDILFLDDKLSSINSSDNIFISDNKLNILNDNNLNQETRQSLESLITHNLGNNQKINSSIKLIQNFSPPEIINKNLIVTVSNNLKPLNYIKGETQIDLEIDMDDMMKFLLFSNLHDMIIYIPQKDKLIKEISYLDYLADNLSILKLLRRNNFFVILDKNNSNKLERNKLMDLSVKLGKTVMNEINYTDAYKDKIKYFGCMIEKFGSEFYRNAKFDEIKTIKTKFEEILKKEDYYNYVKLKTNEENTELEKQLLNTDYIPKKIVILSFKDFKKSYVNQFSNIFTSSSGIDNFENKLLESFMKVLDNKISLIRSNLAFKTFLFENLSEFEMDSDFNNSILFTRNEIVDEINKSFQTVKDIYKIEEINLLNSCQEVLNEMKSKKDYYLNILAKQEIESHFFEIFNLSQNNSTNKFNKVLSELRQDYFKFNKKIFLAITKVSNTLHKIFENLGRNIGNKYHNLFLDLENKNYNDQSFVNKYIYMNKDTRSNDYFNKFENFPIEEIIKNKIEKINFLTLHLISIFGFTNFNLRELFPYFVIPAYGGTGISLFLFTSGFISKNSTMFGTGAIILSFSLLISNFMKNIYIKDSEENLIKNLESIIKFLIIKQEKIINFENVLNDYIKIYSRETLELIDLLTGIEN